MNISTTCTGCGVPLQMDSEDEPGYITAEAFLRDQPLCRRCYRLIHYGQLTPVDGSEEAYRSTVMKVLSRPALVLYVVDLFDLSGSILRGVTGILGKHDILLAANKFDLFPGEANPHKVKMWLEREARRNGVKARATLLVSARTGMGFEQLRENLRTLAGGRRIVVVGMANVGKSTLLNRILDDARKAGPKFTISPYPGTTLGAVSVTLPDGTTVVDTPGLLGRHRLADRVCPVSLKQIMPAERLRPRVYQLNPGQTLFLGGLARLDFVRGAPQPFVVYTANQLRVHRTKSERADELYERQRGDLLTPPCGGCSEDLGRLLPRRMSFEEGQPVDVVFPGLGWIRLAGRDVGLLVHAPAGAEPAVRPALFAGARRPIRPGPPAARGKAL